jgi:Tol biopolymer transport system component
VALLLIGGIVAWQLARPEHRPRTAPQATQGLPTKVTPLTSDGGLKWAPRLSPDGEKVAYVWDGPDADNRDVYVKAVVQGARPLRLTDNPANDVAPAWSPDGRHVAFVRMSEAGGAIYVVPWTGGPERRLTEHEVDRTGTSLLSQPSLTWSPDGAWLAFHEWYYSRPSASRIMRVSLARHEPQAITSPREGTIGDAFPAFSPDGASLAFARSESLGFGGWDVWVQPASGGGPRRLTFARYDYLYGVAWTPDSAEILYTVSASASDPTIHRVAFAGGEPHVVMGVGAALPSLHRGGLLVYQRVTSFPTFIARVPGPAGSRADRAPEKLIVSTQTEGGPTYSPDGRRIAFNSSRAGTPNIWVCDSDGGNPLQLTSFSRRANRPSWSPDGRLLAFDSTEAGDWNVYVVDADGGTTRRLTPEPSLDVWPTWSRDGRWVYFSSNRSGTRQLWRIPREGGQATPVTRQGGVYGVESWDRRHLYYVQREDRLTVWSVPVEGGEEREWIRARLSGESSLAVARSGIYFATLERHGPRGVFTISHLDPASGTTSTVHRQTTTSFFQGLAASPDERWILFSERPPPQSELMLVEGFR